MNNFNALKEKIINISAGFTKKEKILLISVGLSLCLFFFTSFYVPKTREYKTVQKNIEILQKDIGNLSVQAAIMRVPNSGTDPENEKVNELITGVLEKGKLSNILQELDRLSKETGVKIKGISPKNIVGLEGYIEITLEIEIQSDFRQLITMLKNMEELNLPVNIIDLGINNSSPEGKTINSYLLAKTFIKEH